MRKSLLIAAMAGLAFVGCTESELDSSVKSQEVISITPVVRPTAKAAQEIGNVYGTSLKFNVWGHWYEDGYKDGGFTSDAKMYINEATCEFSSSSNTWYPKKVSGGDNYYYWPKNGKLTFIAYSPASTKMSGATTVDETGLTIENYVVDTTNNAEMEDVMFSERAYDKISSTDNTLQGAVSPYNGVDLLFRHALSSIVFNIKQDKQYLGTTITLKSIKLKNVATKATFMQNLEDEKGSTTKIDSIGGSIGTSASPAAWSGHSDRKDYIVDHVSGHELDNDADIQPYYFCTQSQTAPVYEGAATKYYRNSDLLLIPQSLSGVKLEMVYSIKSPDDGEIEQTFEHDFAAIDIWKIGFRYIYNLTIAFDPITFAPTISLFVDASQTGVGI